MPASVPVRAVFLVALLATGLCTPLRGSTQLTRADTAFAILAVASDFESQDEGDVATSMLYRQIDGRFPGGLDARTGGAWVDAASPERSRAGGEMELRVWSTLYGIWLGVGIPATLEAERPEAYAAGLLLGGPAGFLAARSFSRWRPVSPGQARAITWGGTWGALQGWGWANALGLIGGGDIPLLHDVGNDGGASEQTLLLASMLAGSAVGVGGGVLAARREIGPGTATSAMLGGLWGAWFGFASGALLDLDHETNMATIAMVGNAGLAAGAFAGSRWRLSRSRAHLISVGGLLGFAGGSGFVSNTQLGNRYVELGIVLAGNIAGFAAAAALTRGTGDEDDAGADAQASGALLNRSQGGAWSLSAPLPIPVLDRGACEALIWNVPVLNVRF